MAQLAVAVAGLLVAFGTIYRYIWPTLMGTACGVRAVYRGVLSVQEFLHDWSGGDGSSIPNGSSASRRN